MRKGFTLLELIIVIIIIGVLATLGFTQYSGMIEKARGAEARAILGSLRTKAQAFRLQNGSLSGTPALGAGDLDISSNAGDVPIACATTHYFRYALTSSTDPTLVVTATRCDGTGKNPGGGSYAGQTITLTSNLTTGVDTWGGTGPWD